MKADVLLCASLLLKYYSLTPRENVTMVGAQTLIKALSSMKSLKNIRIRIPEFPSIVATTTPSKGFIKGSYRCTIFLNFYAEYCYFLNQHQTKKKLR